jgi:predicted dehydrogenase
MIEMHTAVRAALLFSLVAGLVWIRPAFGDDSASAKPKIQVAFVGVAHIHTPEFIKTLKGRSSEVTVKYVWDHDAARAKKAAQETGATVVDDPSTIWNDGDIKAVIICSETVLHLDLVLAAAKAHKNIYAEKPLGIAAKDAYQMAKAINDAGVLFETGYFMRGDPKILFIRDQIAKGTFGTITRIRGSNAHSGALGGGWFNDQWRWMADPKQSGFGGYGDLGTHTLDIMLWLQGEVTRVTAVISNGTARYPDCDEFGTGLLLFKNGSIGDLAAGWDDMANPVTLEVCGTEAHATIVNEKLYFATNKKGPGSDGKAPVEDLPQGWSRPMDLFLDAVGGKPNVPLVTADEAAYRSAITEAFYKAAAGKTWSEPEPSAGK